MNKDDSLLDEVDQSLLEQEESKNEEIINPEKLAKLEKQREQLLSKLASGNMKNLITRVAFILNEFEATRNSDITLMLKYWEVFQKDIIADGITEEKLYELERLTSIARARAKIQNEYKLFQANENIRRFRRNREDIEKEAQLALKPSTPTVTINCDESGKSSARYAIVGSVWILDSKREAELRSHFIKWRTDRGLSIKDEFHFSEMKRQEFELYKDFFNEAISVSDFMSFKAVIADQYKMRGKSIDNIIFDLHYQVVHQGIEHEVTTGRISLPRLVNFFKDKDEGIDALTIEKLRQYLVSQFKTYFENRLTLNAFSALPSEVSYFIQIADLFTGSLNRILNKQDNKFNHKDEFADYALTLLGINPKDIKEQVTDKTMIYFFE